ncbi:unnamed protein product [Euphydryas editha]|uniref:Transposase n=1 Tax=Euphydryas editha TaxID=104508 RepID=A0AAU9UK97_EUPED|nr:unnamed protein product [Euphydryas editha]
MERLTPEQRLQIVQLYYENSRSQLGLTYGTTWRILRRDLKLKAYKIYLVQQPKPLDLSKRHRFVLWALEKFQEDPTFSRQILFSDETHFWLNGYVNKQNCRIWDKEQPEEIQELSLYPEKTTVWCGLWAGGIIGPYFFKNDAGANVTVNGDRCRAMITDYLMPEIEARDLGDIWFQQDGATSHTSHQSMDLLREHFDFFLWRYVKSQVYADKPASIQALEENITRVIRPLPVEMLKRVIENCTQRMDHLRRSTGQHLIDIIFKK